MIHFPDILVGLAGLAALGLVVLAHDWREERREAGSRAGTRQHALRDWWLRHHH
ncbi:hypothetical protein [Caballeronia sp. Lep1P3]|uniref:hypothetical protein n=1 Tax=Caballeronia sp. Lep1P3 TaxID=2878150 RepID=UPI001FD4CA6E|nr:hypothetical protein [Caballeronia sp. Lep1P3]